MNANEMRELDAWIAEHVMGLAKTPELQGVMKGLFYVEPYGSVLISAGHGTNRITDFVPTSRPADAMDVLNKCRDAGWLVTIKVIPKEYSYIIEGARSEYDAPCEDRECCKGKVMVEGMNMNNQEDWQRHETFADTIELAICLFAKKLFNPKIPRNESPTTDCDPIPRTSHT